MTVVNLVDNDEGARLDHARNWLDRQAPELSSKGFLSRRQAMGALATLVVVVIGVALFPRPSGVAIVALLTAVYVAIMTNRVAMTLASLRRPNLMVVSDEDALRVPDNELPIYTILVPLYHEAAVVPQLAMNLRALKYPVDRLDIKFLVEHDDVDTLSALLANGADQFDVVVVPDGAPRTKPKALNYGLTMARGDLVTIFDAEDRPDPLQLRKAVVAFQRAPAEVGCLQARLEYWNVEQNIITRWFGIEYLQWFRLLLPGLAASDSPVPLGGTSNHIRRDLLEDVGAWDPHNVTEDADLGIRFRRAGIRCAVLDSTTWEEANSDYVNWNNQRSRWYKGYLQTWIVHMRRPRVLLDQLGWRGWFEFNAFVGGTPLLSALNLVFWALTIAWFTGHVEVVRELFPAAVYYPALFCFVFGNLAMVYLYMISARLSKVPSLVWVSALVPLYWLMMGVAALKALWQLVVSRTLWEKTVHGLTGDSVHADLDYSTGVIRESPAAPFESPGPPVRALKIISGRSPEAARQPRRPAAVGTALQVVGAILIIFVLYVVILAGVGSPRPTSSSAFGKTLASRPPAGAAMARIEIPRAGIDQIVVEGATPGTLNQHVGHVSSTALPGMRGTAVVVGHRVGFGAGFADLFRVRAGQDVIVDIAGGQVRYRVMSTVVQTNRELALAPPSGSHLVLVTNAGGWDLSSLLVVRASLVSSTRPPFSPAPGSHVEHVAIAGVSYRAAGMSLLWLALAVVAVMAALALRRRSGWWGAVLLAPVLVAAVCEVCLYGGHALPLTF